MHVQRVHYGKLAALIFVITAFLLIIYRSLPDPRTSLIGNTIMDIIKYTFGIEHTLEAYIQNLFN